MSIQNPDLALQQMELHGIADGIIELADSILDDKLLAENIEDPEYMADMMRLQATQMHRRADSIDDDDDLDSVANFVALQRIEQGKLRRQIEKARAADAEAKKARGHAIRSRLLLILSYVAVAISLLAVGYQLGRAVTEAMMSH